MRRRFQSARLQRIDGILEKLLKRHNLSLQTQDHRLMDIWSEAVGAHIAAQTRPDGVKKSVLFVKVANPAWMQQLHFMKREIIEKFNGLKKTEPLKDIFFAIGAVKKNPEPLYRIEDMPPLRTKDKKMIEKSLTAITDEELRNILKRAMTKEVTRRRMMEIRPKR